MIDQVGRPTLVKIGAGDAPLVALAWCKELLGFVASHDATYLGVRCTNTSRAQRGLKSTNPGAIKLFEYLPHLLEALKGYKPSKVVRGVWGCAYDGLLTSESPGDLTRVGSIQGRLFTC